MQGVRALVVGDVMLDVYLAGTVSRVSPEAPVPVVRISGERYAPGGAANVAANVAALGGRCELLGCVGADAAGSRVREVLASGLARSVEPRLVEWPDRPTTTKTRVMARSQQVVRFDREVEDDLPEACETALLDELAGRVEEADVLILEDYDKGVLTPKVIHTALDAAAGAGVPSVVDPKLRHFFCFGGATVFKPNALELAAALGQPAVSLADGWLEEARERTGCQHLLLTLGEEGMILRCRDGRTVSIPAVAREVYDVSGAGDTVTATVGLALAVGATPEEAAVLATHAAGVEVGRPGVATVSAQEVLGSLREHDDNSR